MRVSILGVAVILLAVTLGCSTAGADGPYRVSVTRGGESVAEFSLQALEALPQVSVEADGKEQRGPALQSVLDEAGVTDLSAITVYGKARGRFATTELRLNASQLNGRVVLDINKQGQTKLASPDISSERWVVDVSRIDVE